MTEEEKEEFLEISKRIGYKIGTYCNEEEIRIFEKILEDYKYKNNLIQLQRKELEKKDKKISDLEYALLDMVMQFADRPHKNGCEYSISTMGLSALELAFSELGLDDPTPVKKANKMYEELQKQYFEKQVEKE